MNATTTTTMTTYKATTVPANAASARNPSHDIAVITVVVCIVVLTVFLVVLQHFCLRNPRKIASDASNVTSEVSEVSEVPAQPTVSDLESGMGATYCSPAIRSLQPWRDRMAQPWRQESLSGLDAAHQGGRPGDADAGAVAQKVAAPPSTVRQTQSHAGHGTDVYTSFTRGRSLTGRSPESSHRDSTVVLTGLF